MIFILTALISRYPPRFRKQTGFLLITDCFNLAFRCKRKLASRKLHLQ